MRMRRKLTWILGTAPAAAVLALLALFAVYYVPDPGNGAPRVLVAVDRSLWNSIGLNQLTYVRKLRLAGLSPVLVEFTENGELSPTLFDDIGGLVLTGGGDVAAAEYGGDPAVMRDVNLARDAFELALLEEAESRSLPILGLCRGAQLMNVHRGGTLGDFRDEPRFGIHRNALEGHAVLIEAGSRLAAIYGTLRLDEVTTWHGQHVAVTGRGIVVTAHSPDGIAEAIEVEEAPFMLGVQWHAEMPPWDEQQERLFIAFADAVRDMR
ncbi:MAG TPA: gamma-glutamyl-gamma-aminobutyrate hydrolase family protein, partial [Woeseiaceae bacterium]|nr:gamma-glutamyl-gamma-aminobutyrate hydrolase family protein [Woeseiaceae bacterium]